MLLRIEHQTRQIGNVTVFWEQESLQTPNVVHPSFITINWFVVKLMNGLLDDCQRCLSYWHFEQMFNTTTG